MKNLIQGSKEWLDFRKQHLGASDSPILMGVSKFKDNRGRIKTPFLLWKEKLGLEEINCDNFATRFGQNMEGYSREVYEGMKKEYFKPSMCKHKDIPYMMASLDGINEDGDYAVEIKNTNKEFHELARQGIVPECYYPQVQHQLACLGHDEMDYFSFNNHEGIIVKVKRDDEYLKKLYSVAKKFWECVTDFTEPPLTANDYIKKTKKWGSCAEELWAVKEEKRKIALKEKELETLLRDMSNDENCCYGSFIYTRSMSKGVIDYSTIECLKGVNLDMYRKPSSIRWGIRKNG